MNKEKEKDVGNNTADNIRLLISGPSCSGKSTLVKQLLHKYFRNKFDEIFIIAPTIKQPLWESVRINKEKENKSDEASDSQFMKYIDKIKKNGKDGKRSLLILDDIVNTELTRRSSALCREILRLRHYDCSIVICTQLYKAIPNFVRVNLTHFIGFHNPNQNEVDKMKDEMGHKFLENYERFTNEQYKYIFVDFTKNELGDERYLDHIKFSESF